MAEMNKMGDSRTLKGVSPKLYIKDEGTTYTTGEEYNGLWSGGTISAPTGFANMGHWRLLEREGRIAFNARSRGNNDIITQGAQWGTDSVGTYLGFNLPENEQIGRSVNHYMMIGTGGGNNETTQWDQFLKTPGYSGLLGSPGNVSLKIQLDVWAYFREPPQVNGEIHTLFYLHKEAGPFSKVLRFCVEKQAGNLYLSLYVISDSGDGWTSVKSESAAGVIFKKGPTEEGGLHHVGFILDARTLNAGDILFADPTVESHEGFYVNGTPYSRTSGNTVSWDKGALSIDVNPFIGNDIAFNNPNFEANKESETPIFENHFTGKIYAVQLNSIGDQGTVTRKRMNTLYNLKFDVPRGPSYIDFSSRFDFNGKNLLDQIGNIEQIVDSEKGNFYVTLQNIRAKN